MGLLKPKDRDAVSFRQAECISLQGASFQVQRASPFLRLLLGWLTRLHAPPDPS